MIPYVYVGNTITFYIDGAPRPITSTHINWRKIVNLISQGLEITNLETLLDVEEIYNNGVYYAYEKEKYLFIAYISKKDNTQYGKVIETYQDLVDLPKTHIQDIEVPEGFQHKGTYADIDDLLTDYVQRFL